MTRRFQFSLNSKVGWFVAFAVGTIPGVVWATALTLLDPAERDWWFLAVAIGIETGVVTVLAKRWLDQQ
ncbi:MAG TPA: hypothetical protein VHC22_05775 [Pirellulales bacterium]|nr:hypothetical protein [Pirellulales bacterium]